MLNCINQSINTFNNANILHLAGKGKHMNRNIKPDVRSAIPQFFIKDESGTDIYKFRGKKGVQVGLQLTFYDMDGNEIGGIEQKKLSMKPTFFVTVNGVKTATIVKKYTAIKQRYEVEELGWSVEGDFLAHDYYITDKTGRIASIRKEWFAWGDAFELNISKESHILEALALVTAIDKMVDTDGNGWRSNGHGIEDIF